YNVLEAEEPARVDNQGLAGEGLHKTEGTSGRVLQVLQYESGVGPNSEDSCAERVGVVEDEKEVFNDVGATSSCTKREEAASAVELDVWASSLEADRRNKGDRLVEVVVVEEDNLELVVGIRSATVLGRPFVDELSSLNEIRELTVDADSDNPVLSFFRELPRG